MAAFIPLVPEASRGFEDAIPELLLFGQLPGGQSAEGEGDEAITAHMWSSVGLAFVERLPSFQPDIRIFRALIDPTVKPILSERYGADGAAILEQIWAEAAEDWAKLPSQTTLGATITVRLAAVTAAACVGSRNVRRCARCRGAARAVSRSARAGQPLQHHSGPALGRQLPS